MANVTALPVGTIIAFVDNANNDGEGIFHHGDVIPGKHYTIEGVDEDGDEYFIDESGDKNYAACTGEFGTTGIGNGDYVVVGNANFN